MKKGRLEVTVTSDASTSLPVEREREIEAENNVELSGQKVVCLSCYLSLQYIHTYGRIYRDRERNVLYAVFLLFHDALIIPNMV